MKMTRENIAAAIKEVEESTVLCDKHRAEILELFTDMAELMAWKTGNPADAITAISGGCRDSSKACIVCRDGPYTLG